MSIDQREYEEAQNQVERRRKSKLFELFQLYHDDYLDYVEEMREFDAEASEFQQPPGGIKGLRAALGLQPDADSDDA